jgi:predicted amidohydrolase
VEIKWKNRFWTGQSRVAGLGLLVCLAFSGTGGNRELSAAGEEKTIRVALIQFDAIPEEPVKNLIEMERLAREAADGGARWIMFHEGTLTDYTPRLEELAEEAPGGPTFEKMAALAKELNCHINYGLSECADGRFYITQVFQGPEGLVHRYRKTWLWREPSDKGNRNEWARYDPGTGPEIFVLDGIRATCFICADGEAPRCIERAKLLMPELVFYPNNRGELPDFPFFGEKAALIGAPMLVTNRTGRSWEYDCKGGCVVYGADGKVLAKANREGREEILYCDLSIAPRD